MAPLRSLGNINSAFDDFYARTGKDAVSPYVPPPEVPAGAVHFLEFGGSNASFTDQIGNGTGGTTSLNFTVNTSKMALNDTTYGGPPGYTDAGFQADTVTSLTAMRTAEDVIPDISGDFTIDVCSYNAIAPASDSNIVWCIADYDNTGGYTNYIYNASGSCRFDTSNTTWNARLGEAGGSANYTQNKWCVSRLRRSSGTMYVEWYEENSGGTGWDLKSGGFNGSVTGDGPNTNNSAGGALLINSWPNSSSYSIANLGVAWIAFFESSYTNTPWVPS
jgi:hypothetical protein